LLIGAVLVAGWLIRNEVRNQADIFEQQIDTSDTWVSQVAKNVLNAIGPEAAPNTAAGR
jgi:hypothetical protein